MKPNFHSFRDEKTLRTLCSSFKLPLLLSERWLSGLRRTPGKREYLKSTVGSNPSLSANVILHL